MALLIVGLGVEFVETAVGYVLLQNPSTGTGLLAAGTAFEAAGIIAFHLWLLASEGYWYDRKVFGEFQSPACVLFLMNCVIAAVASTCLGVFADAVFHFSRKASSRLPHRGAFGNALIWLGAATTEVKVTLYLTWRREGNKVLENKMSYRSRAPWGDFGGSIAALIILEVHALIAVVAARVVFTRARRMLLRLKGSRESPSVEVYRLTAAKPGARHPHSRLSMVLGVSFAVLFCVFAVVGWPSFVPMYKYTKWSGLEPRVRYPRPVDVVKIEDEG